MNETENADLRIFHTPKNVPMTLAEAAAFHEAQAPTFAANADLYDPTSDESPGPHAETAAQAMAAACRLAAMPGFDLELLRQHLDIFTYAYEDGELDAFFRPEVVEMEATYHALLERFAPDELSDWLRLAEPRVLTDLPRQEGA